MLEWVLILDLMVSDLVLRKPGGGAPTRGYVAGRYKTHEECLTALGKLGVVLKWHARCERDDPA
jgi:hypothetical protein